MDFAQVKEIIQMVDQSTLTNFLLRFEMTEMQMSKTQEAGQFVHSQTNHAKTNTQGVCLSSETPEAKNLQAIQNTKPLTELQEPITILPEEKKETKQGNVVVAPLVGTFYASSSPEKPNYVQLGTKVKKGDPLCIIEAMKIMNEVTSNFDGEIVEILAKNEDMVEFGAPLFRIV